MMHVNDKYIADEVFIYEIKYVDKSKSEITTTIASISKTAASNLINAKYRKTLDHIVSITRRSKQGELISLNPKYRGI